MTSVALTGTNHAEDQPIHLRVVRTLKYMDSLDQARAHNENANLAIGAGSKAVETCSKDGDFGKVDEENRVRSDHVRKNVGEFGGLLGRACPAGVYEYVDQEGGEVGNGEGWKGKKLVINSQVCNLRNFVFSCSKFVRRVSRIASTASCVMSKYRRRTSLGLSRRVEGVLNTVRFLLIRGR
jgi:hypothetical protein